MKILIVGLGSMGSRRIRNLYELGFKSSDIFGYDIREDRNSDAERKYNITCVKNPDMVLKEIDKLIISTPPDQHLEYQQYAVKNNKHFFCEAGLFKDGIKELVMEAEKKNILAIPSNTLMHWEEWKKIKELVSSKYAGIPLSFNFHNGGFLPDWHSYESIYDFYVSKRETGGAREIVPFELQWMNWIFGKIEKVFCVKGKLTPEFDADIDDTYHIIYVFKGGVYANVIIDVTAQPSVNAFELTCSRGVINYDYYGGFNRNLKVIRKNEKEWKSINLGKQICEEGYVASPKEPYIKEIQYFLDYIKSGKKPIFTYEDELAEIEVLLAAERSVEEGRFISM